MAPTYYIKRGNLSFAEKLILLGIEIYLYPGDKICLIGKNGCGKSSLLKVITGEYELDSGEIYQNSNTNIGYLTQSVDTSLNISIYDFVLENFVDKISNKHQADIILSKLKLNGEDIIASCSGGEVRRAYLARVLVAHPEILLLDEPTNHLDISTIEWLEEFVKTYDGTIVCISHDRAFLSNTTNKIWWLDRAQLRKSDQGFKQFDEWQEQVLATEESTLRKLNKKLTLEQGWLNTGVTARRKRNQGRLANLKLLRENLRSKTERLNFAKQKMQTEIQADAKQSKFIIEAENLSYAYDNKPSIIQNLTFRVKKGEKIGIIGANGSGKSTFIKLLIKQLAVQSGKITHGTNLEITYFDQHRIELEPQNSLQQILCPSGGDQVFLPGRTMHVAGYLKRFLFDPKLLTTKVATLSGGEASRLLLAKTLINPGNLLILDEPTNDLDMDSLEMLLEILAEYSGTLLIVSHDRDFLENLVTRTLIFCQHQIIDMIGGYEDYQQFLNANNKVIKKTPVFVVAKESSVKNGQRLSYKHQRLLETIPLEIEIIERKIAELELALTNDNLYLSDNKKFIKITDELSQLKRKLDELVNQWLEISIL